MVIQSSKLKGENPRCTCGSTMRPSVESKLEIYDSDELLPRGSWERPVRRRKS